MRIGLCVMAGLMACLGACNKTSGTDGSPAPASRSDAVKVARVNDAVRIFSYVVAKPDLAHPERIPTQVAVTGELALNNDCLILRVGDSKFNLLFSSGTATFNQESQSLTVEGIIYPLGAKVSLGGAGMGVVESMPDGDPKQICEIEANWVVTAGSMKPAV